MAGLNALRRRMLLRDKLYIHGGLTMWLDGIWNNGMGIHASSLSQLPIVSGSIRRWKDLSGYNRDGELWYQPSICNTFICFNNAGSGSWTQRVQFNGNLPSTFTMEAVASISHIQRYDGLTFEGALFGNTPCPTLTFYTTLSSQEEGYLIYQTTNQPTNRPLWDPDGNAVYYENYLNVPTSYALTYDAAAMRLYINGVLTGSFAGTSLSSSASTAYAMQVGNGRKGLEGHLFAVRSYARALSDHEIAFNYSIDKERFNL